MPADRPFENIHKPGRRDVDGIEWWACDPYPCWYRYTESGDLIVDNRSKWLDPFPDVPYLWDEDGLFQRDLKDIRIEINAMKRVIVGKKTSAALLEFEQAFDKLESVYEEEKAHELATNCPL